MSDNNKDIIDMEDNDQEYEDICYICRRPESVAGPMIKIPGNICICKDQTVKGKEQTQERSGYRCGLLRGR